MHGEQVSLHVRAPPPETGLCIRRTWLPYWATRSPTSGLPLRLFPRQERQLRSSPPAPRVASGQVVQTRQHTERRWCLRGGGDPVGVAWVLVSFPSLLCACFSAEFTFSCDHTHTHTCSPAWPIPAHTHAQTHHLRSLCETLYTLCVISVITPSSLLLPLSPPRSLSPLCLPPSLSPSPVCLHKYSQDTLTEAVCLHLPLMFFFLMLFHCHLSLSLLRFPPFTLLSLPPSPFTDSSLALVRVIKAVGGISFSQQ